MMRSIALGQVVPPEVQFDGAVWIRVEALEDLTRPEALAWVKEHVLTRRAPGAVIEVRFWTRVGP